MRMGESRDVRASRKQNVGPNKVREGGRDTDEASDGLFGGRHASASPLGYLQAPFEV